jgi:hypothetical protein
MAVKGKAIPVTGRGGLQVCESSKIPHFLANLLTDGAEVVSLTRRAPFIQEDFCMRLSPPQGHSAAGRIK